jgi:hypothetical protein
LLHPRIVVRSAAEDPDKVRKRTGQAMQSALKYSLVANSIKSKLVLESEIDVVAPA